MLCCLKSSTKKEFLFLVLRGSCEVLGNSNDTVERITVSNSFTKISTITKKILT